MRTKLAVLIFVFVLAVLANSLIEQTSAQVPAPDFDLSFVFWTATLKTPQGTVKVFLPNDMAAGDTISGTVIAEPSGKTEEEKQRNAAELNGYVVELENQKSPVSGGVMRGILLPPGTKALNLTLLDKKGMSVANAKFNLKTPDPLPHPSTFVVGALGQTGKPIVVHGPFDGNSANTSAKVADSKANVIAESPRKIVVEGPRDVVGPTNIEINEKGTTASRPFRNLKIDLTAPKTSLLKGESTELHVQVSGLQGLNQPIQIEIQNQSPSTINLAGGNTQTIPIQPSQVTPGGTFNWSTNVTGTGKGGFIITGSLPGTTPSPSPTPVSSP